MDYRLLTGDVREMLKSLPEASCHVAITSPPYWRQRVYSTAPQVWSEVEGCEHVWGETLPKHPRGHRGPSQKNTVEDARDVSTGSYCQRCGAWRGELGSEPTIGQHLANLVEVFREVRRVLRPDGSLWLNYGDMYLSEGGGRTQGQAGKRAGRAYTAERLGVEPGDGLKPKDLVGMPWRLAFALQEDGWYLRAACPRLKSNALPESSTDRPTCAVEYLFLLTPSPRYYYDAEAVRVPFSGASLSQLGTEYGGGDLKAYDNGVQQPGGVKRRTIAAMERNGGRARRQSDWFFESLRGDFHGMLTDEDGEPLAFLVNPEPTRELHYASYSPKLVAPCIQASSSERGVCAECGAPWVRVVEKGEVVADTGRVRLKAFPKAEETGRGTPNRGANLWNDGYAPGHKITRTTSGWKPFCVCGGEPIPATICDPFSGTASTGAAAIRLGRSYIGIELSAEYQFIAERRLQREARAWEERQMTLPEAEPDPEPKPIATSGRLPLEV